MFTRILSTVESTLLITGTLLGLAAPVVILRAFWIVCSTH
jgi:ABC-type Fe2+-enterobactin transport system substrate-binding protein